MKKDYTMIRVTKAFVDRIRKLKIHPNQSYEEAICKTLDHIKLHFYSPILEGCYV